MAAVKPMTTVANIQLCPSKGGKIGAARIEFNAPVTGLKVEGKECTKVSDRFRCGDTFLKLENSGKTLIYKSGNGICKFTLLKSSEPSNKIVKGKPKDAGKPDSKSSRSSNIYQDRDNAYKQRAAEYRDREAEYKDREAEYKDREAEYKDREAEYEDREAEYEDR